MANRLSHHEMEGEEQHDHDDFVSFIVALGRSGRPRRAAEAHRRHHRQRTTFCALKGFVDVAGSPARLLVQAVGPRLNSYFDRAWKADERARHRAGGDRREAHGPRPSSARDDCGHAQRALMHLLATTSGVIDGAAEAVDLEPVPGRYRGALGRRQRTRSARPCAGQWRTPAPAAGQSSAAAAPSFGRSLHREDAGHGAAHRAAPAGRRQLLALWARADRGTGARRGIALAVLPGDAQPDPDLTAPLDPGRSSIASACASIWWRAASANARSFLAYCRASAGRHRSARAGRSATCRRPALYRDTSRQTSHWRRISSTARSSKAPRPHPSTP